MERFETGRFAAQDLAIDLLCVRQFALLVQAQALTKSVVHRGWRFCCAAPRRARVHGWHCCRQSRSGFLRFAEARNDSRRAALCRSRLPGTISRGRPNQNPAEGFLKQANRRFEPMTTRILVSALAVLVG